MAIARKPKSKTPSDADIDAVINKGGSTPTEKDESTTPSRTKKEFKNILVSVPVSMLEDIDERVADNLLYSSRSQWIREAMVEKLQRMAE